MIRDSLREEIITGKLPAESRLTIAEITKRFNVSQMPVREALQSLQGEGLIEMLPHKGARVLSLNKEFVKNIYDIRGVLEGLMGRLSIPHLTLAALNTLDDLHQKMKIAILDNELDKMMEYNEQFHLSIYKHSHNPEAQKIYEKYSRLIFTLRKKFPVTSTRTDILYSEHEGILKALKAQDGLKVENLLVQHSEGAKNNLLVQMDEV